MANKAMWCRSSSQFSSLDPLQNITPTPTTWAYGRGLGVSMGVLEKSWMAFVRERPIYKWMMKWGTPILGNLHISNRCIFHGPHDATAVGGAVEPQFPNLWWLLP
jgi:hypothetical protein